jgi:hypothetical protein
MHPKFFRCRFLKDGGVIGLSVIILLFNWFSPDFLPNSFVAQAADSYGPACGGAVIDGLVNPAEWSGASTKTFLMVNPANQQTLECTLRVMNDRDYLYLGLTINDDEFTTQAQFLPGGDAFRIDFDNDHSGALFAIGDDTLILQAGSPQFKDGYIVGGTSSPEDTTGGGTSDGVGAASRQGSLNHYEAKHPLCSGDLKDFCLHPGEVVGFRIEYLDGGVGGTFDGSYYYPGNLNISLANIVIADCFYTFIYLPLISK